MTERWQFGIRANSRPITAYQLASDNRFQAGILDQGGILLSLRLPNGQHVAVGFETWDEYQLDKS